MEAAEMKRQPRSQKRKIVRRLRDTREAAEIGSRVFPLWSPPAPMPSAEARRSTRVFLPKASTSVVAEPRDGPPRIKRPILPKILSDRDKDDWLRSFGAPGSANWWNVGSKKQASSGVGAVKRIEPDAMVRETCLEGAEEPLPLEAVVQEPTAPRPPRDKMFSRFYTRKRQRCRYDEHLPLEPVVQEATAPRPPRDRMFSRFYTRKRQRCRYDEPVAASSSKDRKYGIVYIRKRLRRKHRLESLPAEALVEMGILEAPAELGADDRRQEDATMTMVISDSATNFAYKAAGISGDDICVCSDSLVMLVVLVESLCRGGSCCFSRILTSIMYWMGRPGTTLRGLAAILFSGPLAGFFDQHGVHFLPIRWQKDTALSRNDGLGCGLCKLYNAGKPFPLLTFSFSAVPLYFKSLHATLFLASEYLPAFLTRHLRETIHPEEYDAHVPEGTGFPRTGATVPVTALKLNKTNVAVEALEPFTQTMAIVSGFGHQKSQKKRSKSRSRVDRSCSRLPVQATTAIVSGFGHQKKRSKSRSRVDRSSSGLRVQATMAIASGFIHHISQKKRSKSRSRVDRSSSVLPVQANLGSCSSSLVAVPGFQVVPGYDQTAAVPFVHPSIYIHTRDEIERAMTTNVPIYDMDSGDEEWLNQLNSSSFDSGFSDVEPISEDVFEKIIFTLEKDAYTNPAEVSNEERALDICQDLGKRDLVASVFGYWLKKRNKKEKVEPLVKVFQTFLFKLLVSGVLDWLLVGFMIIGGIGILCCLLAEIHPELLDQIRNGRTKGVQTKRPASENGSFSRKKRSSNRQRKMGGRGKSKSFGSFSRKKRSSNRKRKMGGRGRFKSFLQGVRQQRDARKAKEAEKAASEALQKAIHLRSRAQVSMGNADLAAYKSVMALRIAEAKRVTSSHDFLFHP